MAQHVVLLVVAAPLLALGRPMATLGLRVPEAWRRRLPSLDGPERWLAVLAVAFVAQTAAMWGWHAPLLFDAATFVVSLSVLSRMRGPVDPGDAAVVVSGDTGIAHLATGYGTPSVLLFGPTPPAWWGPLVDLDRHRVLWHGELATAASRRCVGSFSICRSSTARRWPTRTFPSAYSRR